MSIIDTLFGRKAAIAPVRPALARGFVAAWDAPAIERAPAGYAELVRAAYADNAVAQRAVRMVAEGVGGAPVTASDPALAALVQATSAGQSLLETVAAQLALHGNAYIRILRAADGAPVELYALRPERVTIVPDARGWPALYRYRAGEAVEDIDAIGPDGRPQIVQVKHFHPLDDHYGLGCLGAAAAAVRVHNAAARWNAALLDNAARPSGALVYDGGDGAALSPAQYDRLRAELAEAFAGAANAGRPLLLEGGLSWQAMSLSPAEMDFVGLKAAAAREIALAFGVPPMLLGLPGDSTYANYREANRALWRLTLLPLAGKILSALAEALAPWWPDAALTVDLDRVPALAEDRERLWAQVSGADFLTREEKRAMLGMSVAGYAALFHVEDRGGDVILPGAFAATLRGNQPLPLLLQHRPDRRIGTARAVEDRRGLRMIGEIEDGEAAALVAADTVTGLSFGYRVRSAEGGRPRRIAALDLVELSLVAIPMQPAARVYAAAHRPSRPKTRKESE